MKVQLDKSFPMPCGPDIAWAFLQDIEAVAGCMPGAAISERLEEGRYKGTVTVKIGPATMTFRGDIAMTDIDQAARSLRLSGKGTDATGSSGASMNLAARVDAQPSSPDRCALAGTCEMSMSGKAASFGARLMNPLADQILRQFAENVAAKVGALQAQRSAADAGAAPVVDIAPPAPAKPLNGLALAWAVIRDWVRGWWSGKKAA